MRLSQLQKYIILVVSGERGVFKRDSLRAFYKQQKNRPSRNDQQSIITKSIERLIDKELLVGYGRRTPKKLFIDEIRLTKKGRVIAKKLLGEQQTLPLRVRKISKKK